MNKFLTTLCATAMLVATPVVMAADDHHHDQGSHNHGSHDHGDHGHDTLDHGHAGHNMDEHMNHGNHGMFMEEREVDGYKISFHVMEANEDMHHGGSHNMMIKIEKDGKVLDDVKINSKVIFPDGSDKSQMLMKMGDWHMNGYDMHHQGKHEMMILFKTADGSKHKAGVYYP